jgi:predicted small secreted protein
MRFRLFAVIALAASLLSGCGYNTFQTNDEAVKRRGPKC